MSSYCYPATSEGQPTKTEHLFAEELARIRRHYGHETNGWFDPAGGFSGRPFANLLRDVGGIDISRGTVASDEVARAAKRLRQWLTERHQAGFAFGWWADERLEEQLLDPEALRRGLERFEAPELHEVDLAGLCCVLEICADNGLALGVSQ